MTLFKAFARKDEKNALANESGFSVRQTNIAKGIACILLLFHHLFYSQSSYDYFTSLMLVNDVPLESIIAVLCKICVAIFLFLSGYGINASINKKLSFTSNKDFLPRQGFLYALCGDYGQIT